MSSPDELARQLELRTRELAEAFERQAATTEILQIISRSPNDTQPVFDAIVRSGLRLFADAAISITLPDGDQVRVAALADSDPARAAAWRQRWPTPFTRDYLHALAILDHKVVDLPDVANAPGWPAPGKQNFLATGYKAITIVPMMRGQRAIGALSVVRRTPGPLSDTQLAIVRTFADQAVIAIENTRLVNELRQRSDDLSEALEQQIATSEVLRVINSSPGNLEPVFSEMLRNARELCKADIGTLLLREGGGFRIVSRHNFPKAYDDWAGEGELIYPHPDSALSRAVATGTPVNSPDLRTEQAYTARNPLIVGMVESVGIRANLAVPMLKDSEVIGAIRIYRKELRPFTDKEIELVQNFAAQAVIAIENARLLSELRQRTDDLSEALEQQTATSEILGVISSSPGELEPVFEAMLQNAVRICGAKFGNIYRWNGETLQLLATHNTPSAMIEARRRSPFRPGPTAPLGRLVATKAAVHVIDNTLEQAYTVDRDPGIVASVELGGIRTSLVVPMLKDNELIGVVAIFRQEVRPFHRPLVR